jgi:hypothetical protein
MNNPRNGWVVAAMPEPLQAELEAQFDGRLVGSNPTSHAPVLTVIQIDPDGKHAPNLIALLRNEAGDHLVRLERDGEMPGLFALAHLGLVKPGHQVAV